MPPKSRKSRAESQASSSASSSQEPLEHIPRPPNAFMLYRSHLWDKIKASLAAGEGSSKDQTNFSKAAGQQWGQEHAKVRKYWEGENKAEEARLRTLARSTLRMVVAQWKKAVYVRFRILFWVIIPLIDIVSPPARSRGSASGVGGRGTQTWTRASERHPGPVGTDPLDPAARSCARLAQPLTERLHVRLRA